MSDDQNVDNEVDNQEDFAKNLKAEMARKFENIQQTNDQLIQSNRALQDQLAAITQQISTSNTGQTGPQEDDYIDPYDPDFWRKKEAAIEKKVEQKIMSKTQSQNQRAVVLSQLIQKYPELKDDNSELTKAAIKKLSSYSESTQSSGEGYKLAVMEAASELDVLPVSKRSTADDLDDLVGDEGDGYGMRSPKKASDRRKSSKKDNLDPKVEAVARQFKLNIDDPEVRKRIIKNQEKFGIGE